MSELIFKSAQIIGDIDEEKGIVKGLGSVFGNIDSDGDVIEKGAFAKTIQENRSRIKYLYQHRLDQPVGTMEELKETTEGLEFVAKLAIKTRLGRDVFEMIKAGVITENSVGFATVKQQFNKSESVNYIKEVKLYEISAVTLAANPLAFINEVKSEVNKDEIINKYLTERFDALNSLVKSNISDELGLAVEFEIKSLKELALREITEPINKDHSAEVEEAEARAKELNILESFIKSL
jgi:hypothetical protein